MSILNWLGLNKGIGGFGPGAVEGNQTAQMVDPLGIMDPLTRKSILLTAEPLMNMLGGLFGGGGGGGGGGGMMPPVVPKPTPFTYEPMGAASTGIRKPLGD